MIASVSSALFGFVFWIVVARFYSTEAVGLASATIAGMGFVVSLSRLGLEMGLVRFLQQSGEDAMATINTVLTIGLMASFATAIIFIAGLGLWSPALVFIRENPAYLAAFIVFTSASTLSIFTDHTYIAGRRAHFALARGLIFSFMKLPLAIALVGLLHSFGIFSSWGISLVVALLISMFFFLPRAQPGYHFFFTIRKQVVKDMVRFAFANYVSSFFWGAPAVVFPIMVLNLLGAESNAYFYIAWAIGSVLTTVPNDVSTSLFAEGSYDVAQLQTNIRRSLKMVCVLLVPAAVLVLVFGDKLLLLFGGSYSESATLLLRILALAAIPLSVNTIFLGIKRVQKDLKSIVGLTAFVAVVALGLAFVLVPDMGIKGAGIAWLAGQGCAALVIIVNWLWRWWNIK
jgi:O-antigen/teichoic acid export membrane protein